MEFMAAIAVIVAVLSPFITALFTKPNMSDNRKRLIAGSVSVVLGLLVALGSGQIVGVPQEVQDWVIRVIVVVGIVVSLAQGFYKQLRPAVKSFEAKTTKSRSDDASQN